MDLSLSERRALDLPATFPASPAVAQRPAAAIDPAVRLGILLDRAAAACEAAEQAASRTRPIDRALFRTARRAAARQQRLETALAGVRAETLEGCIAQLRVLRQAQHWPSEDAAGRRNFRLKEQLVYSICCCLEQLTGLPRSAFAGDRYMDPGDDPHRAAE
jgi:hypothetical protein